MKPEPPETERGSEQTPLQATHAAERLWRAEVRCRYERDRVVFVDTDCIMLSAKNLTAARESAAEIAEAWGRADAKLIAVEVAKVASITLPLLLDRLRESPAAESTVAPSGRDNVSPNAPNVDSVDAARYRWLRSVKTWTALRGARVYTDFGDLLSHESLDAAIDNAMKGEQPKGSLCLFDGCGSDRIAGYAYCKGHVTWSFASESVASVRALLREAAAEIERLQRERDELRGALREHAIRSLFRPHDGPDNEVSGSLCMRCDHWWKLGTPESHAAGCLAKGAA